MATGGDVMRAAKIQHLLGVADTAGAEPPPNLARARVLRFGPLGLFSICKHYEGSGFIDEGADHSSLADGRLSSSQFCG